uniref:Uncharacterized protein n=1 Tax=Alexandrium monilatum TaxID=311494 RepID=A0A7S4QAK6_9DINO
MAADGRPPGTDVAERIVGCLRKHDPSGAGTFARAQVLRLISALGGTSAAEAELLLTGCGFPGATAGGGAEVDYEAFVRSLFQLPGKRQVPPAVSDCAPGGLPCSELDDPDAVFDCCESSGRLDEHELRFALNAFGLFPSPDDVFRSLAGRHSLDRPGFRELLKQLLAEAPESMRRPRAVPYARRGVSLGQLQDLHSTFVQSGWIRSRISAFNEEHHELIEAGEVHPLGPNLYALDRFVIRPATTPGSGEEGLAEHLRRAAKLPEASHYCSYSELVNPTGVQVDYFVSHWWGHPFADTMRALDRWADHKHEGSGKPEPRDVIFWFCFLALNQHRVGEEVGASPEQGPFNAALVRARGAIMVLDEHVHPFSRIWCLYEVSRLTSLGKDFEIVCSLGPVADLLKGGGAGQSAARRQLARETVERIEQALEQVSAFGAQASSDDDRYAIWHRIADPRWRRKPLKFLRKTGVFSKCGDSCFKRFDAKIRGLLATPLLHASLSVNDSDAMLRAIGLGATFTKSSFDDLVRLRSDICSLEVPVKRGKSTVNWKLLHCAAFFGHSEAARCLLAARAEPSVVTRFGYTPLHLAASNGQAGLAGILLEAQADMEAEDATGRTPLHAAAVSGHSETAELLLRAGASESHADRLGETPLHAAAMGGHLDTVELLLSSRANPQVRSSRGGSGNCGKTPLHYAAEDNFADVVKKILCHSEYAGVKETLLSAATKKGKTALDLAEQAGHVEVVELLQ